jgi:hypothetical protein
MMKKQLSIFFLCLGLTVPATVLKADEIRLTSTATSEISLGIGVLTPPSVVSVDWGNGIPADYTADKDASSLYDLCEVKGTPAGTGEIKITGTGITAFDCDFSAGFMQTVTALDVTGAGSLTKLVCVNQSIASLDLSKNAALTRVEVYNSKNKNLTALDVSSNALLTYLNCNGNGLTGIDVSNSPLLDYLNISGNSITSIDVSRNTVLRDLYAQNNQIETVDVSLCTPLRTLNLQNNRLTSLTGADNAAATGTVNCSGAGNRLNLATLPQPGTLRPQYNYAPQSPYQLPESISVGQELDLSSQTGVKGILSSPVATAYSWKTESGAALAVNIDYSESGGKFVFLKAQAEKVACTMTTTAFPKFPATGASAFVTTPVTVSSATGIANNNREPVRIYSTGNILFIDGLSGTERIVITGLQGKSLYSSTAGDVKVSFPLLPGMYVVSIDGENWKVVVKQE